MGAAATNMRYLRASIREPDLFLILESIYSGTRIVSNTKERGSRSDMNKLSRKLTFGNNESLLQNGLFDGVR